MKGERMPIIKRGQLPRSEIAHELVGAEHELDITLLFVDAEPGRGPALHRHPYAEVIIVQDGEADLTLGGSGTWHAQATSSSCSPTRRTRSSIRAPGTFARSTST